jgi:hypothetical protein
MIVREEFDISRLEEPRIYPYPLYLYPIGGFQEEPDLRAKISDQKIVFAPEYHEEADRPDIYLKVWDVPWRWYCQTCYCSSGDRKHVFDTIWVRREELCGRGNRKQGGWDEPSYFQRNDMSDHVRQHEIMYKWARSIK